MAREKRQRGRPKLKADEVKNIKYTVRLDKELDERLQKRVKEDNTTVTDIVRKSLDEYLG